MNISELLRKSFAILAGLSCFAILVYAYWQRSKVPPSIPIVETASQREEATKLRLSLSEKIFEIGIILIGVIWGMVLADKIVINFARWEDGVLFISSNILLLFSLYYHFLYKRRVSTLLWDMSPLQPNIFSPHVDYLFKAQLMFFLTSLIVEALTVFSIKILGGD